MWLGMSLRYITSLLLFSSLILATDSMYEDKKISLFQDVLLVINFNHPHYRNIKELKTFYGVAFPNIVFYGPAKYRGVDVCRHHRGWYSYQTLALAMEQYPDFKGYLYVHDDCILNYWNFVQFDLTKIWFTPPDLQASLSRSLEEEQPGWWGWWDLPQGRPAIAQVLQRIPSVERQQFIENIGERTVIAGHSDIVYLPSHYKSAFIELSRLCFEERVFLEIALPTIIFSLTDKNDIIYLQGEAFRGVYQQRDIYSKYHTSLDFIHPVKLTDKKLWAAIKAKMLQEFNTI